MWYLNRLFTSAFIFLGGSNNNLFHNLLKALDYNNTSIHEIILKMYLIIYLLGPKYNNSYNFLPSLIVFHSLIFFLPSVSLFIFSPSVSLMIFLSILLKLAQVKEKSNYLIMLSENLIFFLDLRKWSNSKLFLTLFHKLVAYSILRL